MSRHEFIILIRLRLGIPVFLLTQGIKCVCGYVIDTYGDHVLGCGHGSLRVKCHNALTDTIYSALLVDNRGSLKEQRCHFDDSSRPGDVYYPDFLTGRSAYFDITAWNSFQPSYVTKATIRAGTAANSREMKKDTRHTLLFQGLYSTQLSWRCMDCGLHQAWTPCKSEHPRLQWRTTYTLLSSI